ncbi:MAG: NUDIX hydrolase [bacterium]
MKHIPKVINSRVAYENAHVKCVVDTLSRDGKTWEQAYLAKPIPDIDVSVIPYENGGVYMLRQYRHANRCELWQFPGGGGEPDASIIESAHRELTEETGFVAGQMETIGLTYNEAGLVNLKTTILVATDLKKGERRLEHTEVGMEMHFFTIAEMEMMIEAGEIQCGFALASWTFFRNYLQQQNIQ